MYIVKCTCTIHVRKVYNEAKEDTRVSFVSFCHKLDYSIKSEFKMILNSSAMPYTHTVQALYNAHCTMYNVRCVCEVYICIMYITINCVCEVYICIMYITINCVCEVYICIMYITINCVCEVYICIMYITIN